MPTIRIRELIKSYYQKNGKGFLYFMITAIIGIASIMLFLTWNDGKMVFPKKPHGTFIQEPHIITNGEAKIIEWTISKKCLSNEYEYRDPEYKPNTNTLWGGKTDGSCVSVQDEYRCQIEIEPELVGSSKAWNIQVSSYQCDDEDYFKSDMITVQL